MAPDSAVSIAAAAGANKAAKGIRVGSVPVTITGSVMARIVATAHIPSVATGKPIQRGCRLARPRSRPIAHSKTRVPITPQIQAVNAATGRCCCSEPETRSGASRLIRSTAIQIPPIPITVHSIQDRSAVVVRRSSGVTWSFIWWSSLAVCVGGWLIAAVRDLAQPSHCWMAPAGKDETTMLAAVWSAQLWRGGKQAASRKSSVGLSSRLGGLDVDHSWQAGPHSACWCPRREEQQLEQGSQRGRPRADLDGVAQTLEEGRPGGIQQALALRPQPGGDGGGGPDRVAGGL